MQYKLDIIINKPVGEVVTLFDNPDNLKEWQPELVSFQHLSGEEGQPGAKSSIVYLMGKRECEMVETIETRNLPEDFTATYETKGVINRMENRFKPVGSDQTHWTTINEFTFTSLTMKFMGFFMKKAFPKQTMSYMQQFKDFAEKQ
ncbi:SRPBCC family protein [Kangiella marina]|uniref:SRPBCC family protein n=1 Tax=Kangiella marina TaxID=1079178 RepID=A0ABP8ICQ2_9GAMM